MSQVKGTTLLNRQAFVRERFGDRAWERVLAALPAAAAAVLGSRILASAWYPYDFYNLLDEAIVTELAGGDQGICRVMGADSARRALAGPYRIYLKEGPEALLARLAVLHGAFYDSGRVQVDTLGPGRCAIRAEFLPRSTRTNCLGAEGFYRAAVEICGGRDVQVSEGRCSAQGAPFCLFAVRWRPAGGRDGTS